ncbi:MAG TPA: SDR family oxidoreductase [Acidimicrobiales bacterium]|nr:SDR family oxidoreductase [Acidimicrobiales bacterium]
MADLAGSVALVTGGASGIGAATVELLRGQGATVVAADLQAREGVTACDVTDEEAVDGLVERIVAEHGRLHLAANVAGTSGVYGEVADQATAAWRHTLTVNLDAVFFCLRAEVRAMREGGGGSIVNVASAAGRMGVPGMADYSASKHGVIGLTKSVAMEEARRGIRVNAVLPGSIRTPMLRGFVGGDEELLERMGRHSPMGRLGEPDEVAEAIVWLLSDAARFVTGECLAADGGVAAS